MRKLSAWNNACAVFLLCTATATTAPAQIFTDLLGFDWTDGAEPLYMSLVQGANGNLYGTTTVGGLGSGNNCCGTVFNITPGGTLTTLYSFSGGIDGIYPLAGLVHAADGNFYGAAYGGGQGNNGTVFRITPRGTLTTLHYFDTTDGSGPVGLVRGRDGNFYGTTEYGGTSGPGTVFRMTPEGVLTTLYSFCAPPQCTGGYYPTAGLVQGSDGNFYGTTSYGGANDIGTVFKITPQGTLTVLHNFCAQPSCTDGKFPFAGLIQATDGNFYGTTAVGGANCISQGGCGTVFKITPKGKLTTLYSFFCFPTVQARCDGGAYPYAGLVQGTDGNLYGTTVGGGANTYGTVFKVTPAGQFTTLHSFRSTDGNTPYGGLVQATSGIFYGTTTFGGTYDDGTVFSLDVGLRPFVSFVRGSGEIGQTGTILGQGFIGTTNVSLNGIPASFTVESDTYIRGTVPVGASTGYVTVTTPGGTLTSNVPFHVIR